MFTSRQCVLKLQFNSASDNLRTQYQKSDKPNHFEYWENFNLAANIFIRKKKKERPTRYEFSGTKHASRILVHSRNRRQKKEQKKKKS